MLNQLLAIITNSDGYSYFDNKAEALIYALIGFLVVFVGIVLIIFVIWLVGLLMRKTDNLAFLTNRKAKKKEESGDVASKDLSSDQSSDEIPDEVKVAIMAALMAYYQEEQPKCEFTVKRIKRL
jgi:Na+-transporting methylmalonyl-CoA/oxaloacetate decarboxylase gamma subunit